MMKNSKQSRNNKGLTLVELIVTVAILALIVAPLLRAFVVSSQTNAKAKEHLRATDLAENLMEDIEAYGLEEISRQVNFQDFKLIGDSENKATASCELNKAEGATGYTKASTRVTSTYDWVTSTATSSYVYYEASGESAFVGSQNADKSLYFALGGLTSDGGKHSYDVLVMASPTTLGTASEGEGGTTGRNVNESDIAEIASIGGDTSRVVSYSYTDATNDQNSITDMYHNSVYDSVGTVVTDFANYKKYIQRTVTVDIEGDTDDISNVNVTYSYSLSSESGYTTDKATNTFLYSRTVNAFNSSANSDDVSIEDLYLLLYPWYNENQSLRDNIVVNNPKNHDIDITIVPQQKNVSDTSNALLYAMNIRVAESTEADGKLSDAAHATIRADLDSYDVTWERYKIVGPVSVQDTTVDAKAGMTGSLIETSTRDRLYDVTIQIYSAGTLFDGGTYNEDFSDAVEPYSTFTGGLVY